MRINEIFHSLQGEGPLMGRPATFVRLGGCLEPYCPWCDTKRAWTEFSEMTPAEVLAAVEQLNCRTIVITGGEPFVQWQGGLSEVQTELAQRGYLVQYETSLRVALPARLEATVVASPKYLEDRWQIDAASLKLVDYFKFVAADSADLNQIDQFVNSHRLDREHVYLMPRATTASAQLALLPLIFEHCRNQGYSLSPRLHVLAYDDKPGV